MKRLFALIAFVIVGALLVSCADDIYLEGQDSLAGKYSGTYSIDKNSVVQEQNILWKFTDQTWTMKIDLDNMNPDFCICECYGRYSIEDRVRLEVVVGDNPNGELCVACNSSLSPSGMFDLSRPKDSVVLKQVFGEDGNSHRRTITLSPVANGTTE
ncbi:MAG: hypothetical protein U9N55_05545 [candidate division Zixibacteria bacterium]|nr:hypothetical protein [candidate division Zixibacteria bacterium]